MRAPRFRFLRLLAPVAVLLALAALVQAVIKLELTVSKIFQTSRAVLTGTTTAVAPDTRLVEIRVAETLKGQSPGERLRVQVVAPTDLIQAVAPGQPIVAFLGDPRRGGLAALHLADTWLLANPIPGADPPAWRTVQVHEAAKTSFPGRTEALVRILAEIKAGRNPLLDRVEQRFFRAGAVKLAATKLSKPRWILAADVNGDRKQDLFVGSSQGTRLLLAVDRAYEDATSQWGPWPAAGAYHATGDANGDGKPDLVLDDVLWINQGQKFVASGISFSLPRGDPLATALADVTQDKRPDALFLSAGGQLHIFENPGGGDQPWKQRPAAKLWDDASPATAFFGDWGDNGLPHVLVVRPGSVTRYALDGGAPADFQRLTGVDLSKSQRYRDGLKGLSAVALDVNGDRRVDLYAACDAGALLLVNRGYGAFLLDPDPGGPATAEAGQTPALKLTPATCWAAADLHATGVDDLLILTDDGALYEVSNQAKSEPGRTE